MIDITRINNKNTNNIDVIFLNNIIDTLGNYFTDMLYRIIIYNYSKSLMYLVGLLKKFLDNETQGKIIISKQFKPFIDQLIINNKDTNNRGIQLLHYCSPSSSIVNSSV